MGAAHLAGLATGRWSGTDELVRLWRSDRTFESVMDAAVRDERYAAWQRAVARVRSAA